MQVKTPVQKYPFCATAGKETASSIHWKPSFTTVIVTVFPAPDVWTVEEPPNTFKILAAGTAVPESVTKLVGTAGGTGPDVVLAIPACEITHLP